MTTASVASAVAAELGRLRVASGVDVHPFVAGRPLVLAGVQVPHTHGLAGHSDADVVAHAVTDALLGGAGMGDIGSVFPSEDEALRGADSLQLLQQVVARITADGVSVVNVDAIVIAQQPRLAPHRYAMRANLAATLALGLDRVTVRATTTDHLGFVGRSEGIACLATCLVLR